MAPSRRRWCRTRTSSGRWTSRCCSATLAAALSGHRLGARGAAGRPPCRTCSTTCAAASSLTGRDLRAGPVDGRSASRRTAAVEDASGSRRRSPWSPRRLQRRAEVHRRHVVDAPAAATGAGAPSSQRRSRLQQRHLQHRDLGVAGGDQWAAGRPWPPGSRCPRPARGAPRRTRRPAGSPCARPGTLRPDSRLDSATRRDGDPGGQLLLGQPQVGAHPARCADRGTRWRRRSGCRQRVGGLAMAVVRRGNAGRHTDNPVGRHGRPRTAVERGHDQARTHHRHHRPGRLLPGRAAARPGLRGHRHGPPLLHGHLRAHRPPPGPHRHRARRPARPGQPDRACCAPTARPRSTTWRPRASCRPASASRCSPAT